MIDVAGAIAELPRPLTDYPVAAGDSLVRSLIARAQIEPFNGIATAIFLGGFLFFLGFARATAAYQSRIELKTPLLVGFFGDGLKTAVVAGAVGGGGPTLLADAPNPAGQALLSRFFGGSVSPLGLMLGALVPTLITAAVFRLL